MQVPEHVWIDAPVAGSQVDDSMQVEMSQVEGDAQSELRAQVPPIACISSAAVT